MPMSRNRKFRDFASFIINNKYNGKQVENPILCLKLTFTWEVTANPVPVFSPPPGGKGFISQK